jgi:hypothetical protein
VVETGLVADGLSGTFRTRRVDGLWAGTDIFRLDERGKFVEH